eukprot:14500496-Heterocapsa_arctica.AAC.1
MARAIKSGSRRPWLWRSFLLPLPSKELKGVIKKPAAEYADGMAISRGVLREMGVPIYAEVLEAWQLSEAPMLQEGLSDFLCEHGDLN